ncbi:MAG: OmpW/AlkL family protein [Paracoccus sp. (in: a-proteobacteria)]
MKTLCRATAVAIAIMAAMWGPGPAAAQAAGDWTLGIGIGSVQPVSRSGRAAGAELEIGAATRPTITVEYFPRDRIGIELMAATPFRHDITLVGAGRIGSVTHLPPILSLQYHHATGGRVTPFVGLGLNLTNFFDERTEGLLTGADLQLRNSTGLALHAGADIAVSDRRSLRADIRWIDLDSDVILNGVKIGSARIDPVVLGAAYVLRF